MINYFHWLIKSLTKDIHKRAWFLIIGTGLFILYSYFVWESKPLSAIVTYLTLNLFAISVAFYYISPAGQAEKTKK